MNRYSYRFKSLLCAVLLAWSVAGSAKGEAGAVTPQGDTDALAFTRVGTITPADGARIYAMVIKGSRAYVTEGKNSQYRLLSYDISNPQHPITGASVPLQDTPRILEVSGTTAYVLTAGNAVEIVNMGQLQSPATLGTYSVPGATISSIDMVGIVAYVSLGTQGLRVVDLGNPASPQVLSSRPDTASSVYVADNRAYVFTGAGLTILDVTNPAGPTLLGQSTLQFYGSPHASGNLLFLTSDWVLDIFDVSNPANVIQVGRYSVLGSGIGLGSASSFRSGNVLYIANNNLYALDVSNPSNLFLRGSYATISYAYEVTVVDDLVYVNSLSKLDILRRTPDTAWITITSGGGHLESLDGAMEIRVNAGMVSQSQNLEYTRRLAPAHQLPQNFQLVRDFTLEAIGSLAPAPLTATLTITHSW